ncbi:MAG: hypothetical protein PHO63_05155, partial [Bacilli bacterium]|nr:hypothetical protein [Bacilli bacterium]
MKNTEWGAVAYLSHSTYRTNSEIYKNNSSSFYTGRSGGNVGGSQAKVGSNEYINTGFYTYDGKCATTTTMATGIASECVATGNTLTNKALAYKASTTGNIYGVYDMSGGRRENMMSMYRPTTAVSVDDASGFSAATSVGSLPTSEYWDRYTSTNTSTACNGGICYGSALSETSGWYSDESNIWDTVYPWSDRGRNSTDTNIAGPFAFSLCNGGCGAIATRLIQIKP